MNKHLPDVLETERLILRPLKKDDKSAIYKWASDPEVAKFMRYPLYKSPDDADFWLDNIYNNEGELDYGFVDKVSGELIGSGGLIYHPESNEWSLGYNLRRDFWNKGLATEASRKIIEHARNNFNAKLITAAFAIENTASGRVIEKLGMTYQCDIQYTKFDGSETFKAKQYKLEF